MTDPVPAVTDEQLPAAPVPPAPVVPDRADAPVSEIAERFLRAVVAQVPVELIEELHLFSPLRQGTVETGIAVLALRVRVVAEEAPLEEMATDESGEPQLPFGGADGAASEGGDADGGTAEVGAAEVGATEAGATEADETGTATTEALTAEAVTAEAVTAEALEAESDGAVAVQGSGDQGATDVIAAEGDDDEDVSYVEEIEAAASADEGDEAEAIEAVVETPVKPVRHTVYTARYRYVIKGPERGKWESSIKAEADAPLITVETVVRGVQRRAGEESEIVRYTGAQIARALRIALPA